MADGGFERLPAPNRLNLDVAESELVELLTYLCKSATGPTEPEELYDEAAPDREERRFAFRSRLGDEGDEELLRTVLMRFFEVRSSAAELSAAK
jgi:hypothetical protein